jgi:hypothetical protein
MYLVPACNLKKIQCWLWVLNTGYSGIRLKRYIKRSTFMIRYGTRSFNSPVLNTEKSRFYIVGNFGQFEISKFFFLFRKNNFCFEIFVSKFLFRNFCFEIFVSKFLNFEKSIFVILYFSVI